MKKLVFSCLLILICAPLYPSWWEGGAGRVMSLGWCSVALPDADNIYDLYDSGFISAILQRERKDIISLAGGVYPVHFDFGTSSSDFLGFESTRGDENFDLLWLSKNSAVIIKPFYFNGAFSDSKGFSSASYLAACEIQHTGSFDDKLSASLSVRYTGSMTPLSYPNGDLYSIGGGRLDYSADLGLKISPEIFLGISTGNSSSTSSKQSALIRELYGDFSSRGFRGYDGQANLTAKTTLDFPYTAVMNYHTNGENISAGIQYVLKDSIEAVLTIGTALGYSYVTDMTYKPWNDLYQHRDEGYPLYSDAKWRSYIGDNLIAGGDAGGSFYSATYTDITPTGRSSGSYTYYNGHIALGAAYRNNYLTVPAEIYLTSTDLTYTYSRSINVCAGVEWKTTDWLALRLGTLFPVARESIRGVFSSEYYEITGGLGLNFSGFLANLGARYFYQKDRRDPAYFPTNTYSVAGISAVIDIKFVMPEKAQNDAMNKNAAGK